MKFSTHCYMVLFNFLPHTILKLKNIGNNTMKKCYRTAPGLLITGCAQQTFTVQNKPAAVALKGNHHPSFLRFWNWAEENCRCSQNLWRRRKCC